MGKRASWLSEAQGTEVLQHLQVVGEPALPEVGNFMRQYFRVLRKKGESMSAYCVRQRDEYEKMCRSLARMLREQKKHGQPHRTPWRREFPGHKFSRLHRSTGLQPGGITGNGHTAEVGDPMIGTPVGQH